MTCHFALPFSVWWWETKSPCKSYAGRKRPKKGKDQVTEWCMERLFENLGLLKQSKLPGNLPLNPTRQRGRGGGGGGLQGPNWTPSCKGQCADARCVMAYDHKTQSFMKSRGQQNCLDKTLLWQITIISLWCCLYFSASSTFNFAYLNFPQNANVSDNVQWLHSTRLPTSLNWYECRMTTIKWQRTFFLPWYLLHFFILLSKSVNIPINYWCFHNNFDK